MIAVISSVYFFNFLDGRIAHQAKTLATHLDDVFQYLGSRVDRQN